MRTSATLKSEKQKLGIYDKDLEYPREFGDLLRTVDYVPNKLIAEAIAARFGFGYLLAHSSTSKQVRWAKLTRERRTKHRQELAHKLSRGIRI